MKIKHFCLIGLLLTVPHIFASTPIHVRSLMGASPMEARLTLLAAAETFLGTPYRYAGIDKNGMDCSGFVYVSFREGLNFNIPRSSEAIYNWAQKIETPELQPGDLVFFITAGGRRVSHLGIYAGGGWFIHSASEGPHTGVIYSRLDESYWNRTYLGAGRALPWDPDSADLIAEARETSFEGAAVSTAGPGAAPGSSAGPGGPGGPGRPGTDPGAPGSPGGPGVSIGGPGRAPTAPSPGSERGNWGDPGLFTAMGATWAWGPDITNGMTGAFRGMSLQAMVGYRWPDFHAGFQVRPEWDNDKGMARLPFAAVFGNDIVNVFTGPTGDFGRDVDNEWHWEIGISAGLPMINTGKGAFSFFGELIFRPGGGANFRASTGVRYYFKL